MRRRDFITGIGGATVWPLAALAQPSGRMRRVGALFIGFERGNSATGAYGAELLGQALQKFGWVEGRNLHIDPRFANGDYGQAVANAAEIVNLGPDVVFALGGPAIQALQQRTQTIPIVFVGGGDVGESNLAGGIARPTGNTTGFANTFASLGGKWIELLKETASGIARVADIFPECPS